MKHAAAVAPPAAAGRKSGKRPARVHPVIIYPFHPPGDYSDLEGLYELVARLDREKEKYARPITVMDRKTHYLMASSRTFEAFRRDTVARHSDILDAWCVDTCQMWYTGLGRAFELGGGDDVYWLIPGDFNYGTAVGKEVLGRLHDLPEIILELGQDLCIGEIGTDHNNPKQIIDTYGTFALMYLWFPEEARAIRQITERPRSEFFAIRHGFLREMLTQRWYAYEQTVVMLLKAVFSNKQISRFFVGHVSDLPEGRESLASAVQQVERTERVLKSLWRERHPPKPGWMTHYSRLEIQSEHVLRTALLILENTLR
ncbi:MAG: hypothetical protein JXQ71_11000 [Verrucomicrobia bacterium]|nr:hypothetical protein [Verrucomicrobiota bacterium]